jgi:hypothetical protein
MRKSEQGQHHLSDFEKDGSYRTFGRVRRHSTKKSMTSKPYSILPGTEIGARGPIDTTSTS